MNETREYELQGARARESRPGDGAVILPGLRVLTWLGVALLVAAGIVLALPLQMPHDTGAGYPRLRHLSETAVLAAVVVGCTGVVVIAVRVAAGAVIRAVGPAVAPAAHQRLDAGA